MMRWIKYRWARKKAAAMWQAKRTMLASNFNSGSLVRVPSLVMQSPKLFTKFAIWCRWRVDREWPMRWGPK